MSSQRSTRAECRLLPHQLLWFQPVTMASSTTSSRNQSSSRFSKTGERRSSPGSRPTWRSLSPSCDSLRIKQPKRNSPSSCGRCGSSRRRSQEQAQQHLQPMPRRQLPASFSPAVTRSTVLAPPERQSLVLAALATEVFGARLHPQPVMEGLRRREVIFLLSLGKEPRLVRKAMTTSSRLRFRPSSRLVRAAPLQVGTVLAVCHCHQLQEVSPRRRASHRLLGRLLVCQICVPEERSSSKESPTKASKRPSGHCVLRRCQSMLLQPNSPLVGVLDRWEPDIMRAQFVKFQQLLMKCASAGSPS
mmetsp:Transcript_72944/g.128839  ORF Transcript_72944/g.128839 Transcript_72944/m.128839 type:complete len:303 (-) Transcript_72944:66-974(-)